MAASVFVIILTAATYPVLQVAHITWEDLFPKSEMEIAKETNFFARNYDVNSLPNNEATAKIKYGYELIINTPKYIGPNNGNPKMIFAGNNLACNNCHLNAGTKEFAAPYIGLTQRFPQFRGREGKEGTIEDRINGCMERSMNGHKLPADSREMEAIVAYMEWLSRDMPKEYAKEYLEGRGFTAIEIPNRAVNLENGKTIYETQCITCHAENGNGQKKSDGSYSFPPLWGMDSYNHGAGMHRVLTAAKFIKGNMPLGATDDSPILTDEEAFDVAGYINSFKRPIKENTAMDFPDKKLKPVSAPYPPYADHFSEEQHKYGPFPEIIEYYLKEYGIQKTK